MSEQEFSILGKTVREPTKSLETFLNPGVDQVDMTCSEFTSLCPVTGQPDYGVVHISYKPNEKCLESKSLKLYLWTFREEGTFCEALARQICEEISEVLEPSWIQVDVIQNPRGGIGITASARKYFGMDPEEVLMAAAEVISGS